MLIILFLLPRNNAAVELAITIQQQASHVWTAGVMWNAHCKGVSPQSFLQQLTNAAVWVAGKLCHSSCFSLNNQSKCHCTHSIFECEEPLWQVVIDDDVSLPNIYLPNNSQANLIKFELDLVETVPISTQAIPQGNLH